MRTVELVRAGTDRATALRGRRVRLLQLDDFTNIRNIREYGGGGLLDIGCYPIKTSRMVFGEEPLRVSATLVRDPQTRRSTC